MLSLTNCEVLTAKYSNGIVRTEIRSVQKTNVGVFSVWSVQLVNKSFIV